MDEDGCEYFQNSDPLPKFLRALTAEPTEDNSLTFQSSAFCIQSHGHHLQKSDPDLWGYIEDKAG